MISIIARISIVFGLFLLTLIFVYVGAIYRHGLVMQFEAAPGDNIREFISWRIALIPFITMFAFIFVGYLKF